MLKVANERLARDICESILTSTKPARYIMLITLVRQKPHDSSSSRRRHGRLLVLLHHHRQTDL